MYRTALKNANSAHSNQDKFPLIKDGASYVCNSMVIIPLDKHCLIITADFKVGPQSTKVKSKRTFNLRAVMSCLYNTIPTNQNVKTMHFRTDTFFALTAAED